MAGCGDNKNNKEYTFDGITQGLSEKAVRVIREGVEEELKDSEDAGKANWVIDKMF